MYKRGPIIAISGLVLVLVSLSIAMSVVPSDLGGSDNMVISSLFEEMFDKITNEILIKSGDTQFVPYSTISSDVSLLWGIQIIDYVSGDKLLIKISNIFGDNYGEFTQNEPIFFQMLEMTQSDTLNLEIHNLGTRDVSIIAVFSEDPENSDTFSNPNSTVMNIILPLAISGILLIIGFIILIIGVIVILMDLKNNQNNKRNY
ncbi:MAG: hypothetical protein ACE5DU_05260 [Nitrosopumilus sp.]